MDFCRNLYMSKKLYRRQDKIVNALKKQQSLPFIHIITLPLTADGVLEIYPAYILQQKLYQELPIKVVGIASDRGSACELVQTMIDESIKLSGSVDVRQLFKFD